MNQLIKVTAILLFTGAALTALGGCSVNVIVAPGAYLGIDSNNARVHSQTAQQFNEQADLIPVLAELYE